MKSARSRALDVVFTVLVLAACAFGLVQLMLVIHRDAGFGELGQAFVLGMVTFLRVALLTLVCSVIWVPIGAMIGMNPRVSRFMQPIVQVLASFPSNFTFPFVTLWFVACSVDINWGSILLMALGTQWYILFNVIAGASQIPDDLREMTRSFQLGRWQRWRDLDFAGGIRLVGHGRHYGCRWGVECLDCLGNRKLWAAYADRLRLGRVYRRGHRKRQHREDHHRRDRDERVRGGRQPPVLEPAAAHGRAPFRTELKT